MLCNEITLTWLGGMCLPLSRSSDSAKPLPYVNCVKLFHTLCDLCEIISHYDNSCNLSMLPQLYYIFNPMEWIIQVNWTHNPKSKRHKTSYCNKPTKQWKPYFDTNCNWSNHHFHQQICNLSINIINFKPNPHTKINNQA